MLASSPTTSPISTLRRTIYHAALWLVALSGAITFLFARTQMSPLITAAVAWHAAGGVILGAVFFAGLLRRSKTGILRAAALVLLGTGVTLIAAAAIGYSVTRISWVWWAHVAMGLCTLGAAIGFGLSRMRGKRRTASPAAMAALTLSTATAALAGVAYRADEYFQNLTATNSRQAANPLFPAGTVRLQDQSWPADQNSESCDNAGCHAEIAAEWSRSQHAHSASSLPGDRRSDLWCAGCHNTSALLSNPKSEIRNPKSIGCFSCHAMAHAPTPIGNGVATFAPPASYPFQKDAGPASQWLHGFLLRLRPEPHTATLSLSKDSQDPNLTCAACHRMSVNVAQNRYKFLRYDDTWAEWQSGPYSGESLRSFQIAPDRRTCIDCHMPRGKTSRADHTCLRQLPTMTANRDLRIDIFALRRQQQGIGGSERVDAPLENRPVSLSPGVEVTADVLVENRGIGHAFPAATDSGENVWLDLRVEDAAAPKRPAPSAPSETSHLYGQLALDQSGSELTAAHKDRMVATAYRRFIGPGEADVAHFRFAIPHTMAGRTIRLDARLMRTRHAREGASEVLAEHYVLLNVQGASGGSTPRSTRIDEPFDAPRFYAYGVGLLLQGDNGRARRAFIQANRLAPRETLYLIGAARAYLAEHDLLSARAALESALRIRPGMPQALVWLGVVQRESGEYAKSLETITPLLERYPRDRDLRMEVGLCRRQLGDNAGASEAFEAAMAVDPDDAAGHLNLMSSLREERRFSAARRENAIFRALQKDDSLRVILEPYYAAHHAAARESQPIHEHRLTIWEAHP